MDTTTGKPAAGDDDLIFAQEDAAAGAQEEKWKVLIVDDEPQMHTVTRLALQDIFFQEKGLELISAYSAEEARRILQQHDDIALVLLDVVMEEDDAGLKLVEYIRNTLRNTQIRIVLRTGQPGMAPERMVIENYDIDDYRAKTELTAQKLYTAVIGGLRAFKEIMRIEKIVESRTQEIREINTELTSINNDLVDSINYARRIQLSILPSAGEIRAYVPRFFVFYEAKDIVSGDFYWFHHRGPMMYFAAVDCTGHGVPGAFMSVLGYSLLNQIVSFEKDLQPAAMLERLREMLVYALQHHHTDFGASANNPADGMDIALCCLNRETLELKFSGARRPMYRFGKDGRAEFINGTRSSVAVTDKVPFEQHTLQLWPGDTCYLFTDGITDQFGGENARKLSPPRLREFLKRVQAEPFDRHQELIQRFYLDWKGEQKQTDDILVLGMQV